MSKPQVNLNVDGIMLVGLLVGVPLLGYIGWKMYGAKDAIASAVDKVNPASNNNFVNQGVESIGQALTGDDSWTLGGWAFDWTHNTDGSYRPQAGWDVVGLIPGAGSGLVAIKDAATAVNPMNPDNVINGGFNRITQWMTGDENFTLGGWLYDVTHDDPVTGAKAPINVVNPASDKNIINQGVEYLGQKVSGNNSWTLGGWIYDVFNPGE